MKTEVGAGHIEQMFDAEVATAAEVVAGEVPVAVTTAAVAAAVGLAAETASWTLIPGPVVSLLSQTLEMLQGWRG